MGDKPLYPYLYRFGTNNSKMSKIENYGLIIKQTAND